VIVKRGRKGTPRNPNLATGWRSVVSFTLRPFYLEGKGLRYLLIGGWMGPKANLNGGKNYLSLLRNQMLFPSPYSVGLVTDLSLLIQSSSYIGLSDTCKQKCAFKFALCIYTNCLSLRYLTSLLLLRANHNL
jgi:hypothetical protein